MKKQTIRRFILFFSPFILLFLLTCQNPLFWDTVQFAYLHPTWYVDTHFQEFLLPNSIDSGHPPTFGIYIAIIWSFFGKSLFICHAAMLPFIAMIVLQAIKLGDNLFPSQIKFSLFITGIILSECVLISQCSLASPDILLMAFFLYAFNSIIKNNKFHLAIAVLLLSMLSMRAMMCAVGLYIFYCSLNFRDFKQLKINFFFKKVIPFIPGCLLGLLFFSYHYYAKGWIGYHRESEWASSFQRQPFLLVCRNFLILGWRIMDLGKIATVLASVVLSILWLSKKIKWEHPKRKSIGIGLLALALSLLMITGFPLCFYTGLLSHRYLLPLYFSISILAVFLIANLNIKKKYMWCMILIITQLSGHFWTYPRYISQGWDSTLSYLPIFKLRADFKDFMKMNGIEKWEVGTSFPLIASDLQMELEGDTTKFKNSQYDSVSYILYSNVCNEMNKGIGYYFENWKIIKQEKIGNVEMVLFKKNKD